LTVVASVAESFAEFGSNVVETTLAVFDTVVPANAASTVTTIVMVADAPVARFGTVQVTVEVPLHETPAEPDDETNVVPDGSTSVTWMPLPVLPVVPVLLFVTVRL
jgi:hypothetical protein